MSFDGLGLSPDLLRAVSDEGYTEPTPVQAAAIPVILEGRDVMAGAQTGTGKTAAFVLPVIQRLHATRRDPNERRTPVRVLVVVPTRELCIQVEESVRTYGKHRPIRSATVYGGVGFGPQVSKLRAFPEIVVATPGRLLDHLSQRTIDLGSVEVLILDEADRMLDMGFIRDIRKILALLPPKRQNLLFSATFSDDIKGLAAGLLDDPVRIQVTPQNTTAELIDQLVIPVDRERKRDLLRELVALGRVKQALVFTRTKHGANRLALQLEKDGIKAAAIHGNKSQAQRVRALDDFKAGRVDLLVATDVAARGIDIEQLPHVINFELPMVPEDYVHRIGRTGRAGVDGQAISLVCVDEKPLLQEIQQLLRRSIPTETVAGFEPDRSIRPQPIRLRSTPAERAETAANRAASRGADGTPHQRPGARPGRSHAGGRSRAAGPRPGAGVGAGRGADRPAPRGDDGFVARPTHGGGSSQGGGSSRGGGRGRRGGSGASGGSSRGGGYGSAVPGTSFGNAPQSRPSQGGRSQGTSGGRQSQPRGQGSSQGGPRHARPTGPQGQGSSSGGANGARALPGERIQRLG